MRPRHGLLTLILAAHCLIGTASAQDDPSVRAVVIAAAPAEYTSFTQAVEADNFAELGFATLEEVSRAKPDVPFADTFVPLDELRAFKAGADPERLLQRTPLYLFPVVIGEQVRSGFEIAFMSGWRGVSLGAAELTQDLASERARQAAQSKLPLDSFFILRVPALALYFVAYRLDSTLWLNPIQDVPAWSLKAGGPQPAARVFEQLASVVQNIRPLQ